MFKTKSQGATEWVLNDCTHVTVADGSAATLDPNMRKTINNHVLNMADRGTQPTPYHP